MMNNKLIEIIQRNIHLPQITSCEQIEKGWSMDEKYLLTTIHGKYLVRKTSIENVRRKMEEFELLQKLQTVLDNTPKAIGFIQAEDMIIQVLTYVEGESLEEVIHQYAQEDQYEMGVQAGKILLNIHTTSYSIPNCDFPLLEREKIKRRIEQYQASKYLEEQDLDVIRYVMNHLDCISNYQVVLCHGDYHIGNLIVHEKNVYVIDFNRFDFEDPFREFVPMLFFSRKKSTAFAKGQLMGYFNGNIPDTFWERLSVYAAYISMYSLLWAEKHSEQDVREMKQFKSMIYDDFECFHRKTPKWVQGEIR